MAFQQAITSVLTGVTPSQLRRLRQRGIIVPEIRAERPPLYSMRDLIALRTIAHLRPGISFQKISKAFENLDLVRLEDHPSAYRFGTDGETIFVEDASAEHAVFDLVKHPGQRDIFTFDELTAAFKNFRGDDVVNFHRPAPNLEVQMGRLGGWPTVANTRIPYDTVADLIDGETITVDNVSEYYPSVSPAAARDAIAFDRKVRTVQEAA